MSENYTAKAESADHIIIRMPRCDYRVFINTKSHLVGTHGFDPIWMPDFLYDFQKKLLDWALVKPVSADVAT